MPWTPRSKVGAPASAAAGFGQGSGQPASPCVAPCPAQRPGSPARSALLVSRGLLLAVLELPSSPAGEPPSQRYCSAAALSPPPCVGLSEA